jgi:hypothetical protein
MTVIVLAALASAGCADHSNPENVDRRAVERWNHLIAHEAEKAYDYLSPGFRATQTRDVYAAAMNSRPLQWKSAKFNHKECEEDRCKAYVDVAYTLKMPGGAGSSVESTSTQSEIWIRVDGEWYFLPK